MNKLGTSIPAYQTNRAEMPGPTPQNPAGYTSPGATNKLPNVGTNPVNPPTTPGMQTPPTQPTGPTIDHSNPYDEFYSQYGTGAGALRPLMGFNGSQSNIDLLAPFRITDSDGSSRIDENNPQFQDYVNKGYITKQDNGLGGDQQGMEYHVNQDKLPGNKFGNMGISAYDPSMKLNHDQYKYYDQNYGWITPTANVNTDAGIWDSIYQYAPALFTMGMGAMAAPVAGLGMAGNIASKLPSLAQQFGNGNFNAGGLLSTVGGQLINGGGGGGGG